MCPLLKCKCCLLLTQISHRILDAHSNLKDMGLVEAKMNYIKAWQALPDYGTTYFLVKMKGSKKEVRPHITSQYNTSHRSTTHHITSQYNTSHHSSSYHIAVQHITSHCSTNTSHRSTTHHITVHHITSQFSTSHYHHC